jgi:putative FmdB family regulatory protein
MPTYEFRCPNGHEFERFFRKISDAPSTAECPECHQQSERRMSAGAGLLFKGSGFYITDYGKDGKKDQRAGSKSGGESGSESKSDSSAGKSESKGESKSESKSDAAPAAKPAEPKKSAE